MTRKNVAAPSQWVHNHSPATYSPADFIRFLAQHAELWEEWPETDHEARQRRAKGAAQCLWAPGSPPHTWTCTAIMVSMYATDDSKTHKDPWTSSTPMRQKQRFTYPRKVATPGPESDREDDDATDSASPSRSNSTTPAPDISVPDNSAPDNDDTHLQISNQLLTPASTPANQRASGYSPDTLEYMVCTDLQARDIARKMARDLQAPIEQGRTELNRTPPQDPGIRKAEEYLFRLQALQDNFHRSAELKSRSA